MKQQNERNQAASGDRVSGFQDGVLVGLLIASGHLGGDARQPQVTLRMHVRHRNLFRWLLRLVPGSRLYGPYHHGGRSYFQWMVRGAAIRDSLVPLLSDARLEEIDPPTHERLQKMIARYQLAER